ncbi:MAG: hypothetical protein JRN68_09575 [Nitrososphaerota archaeon]|nr:hypothetical protein [Nitrososphaerota archaeon]
MSDPDTGKNVVNDNYEVHGRPIVVSLDLQSPEHGPYLTPAYRSAVKDPGVLLGLIDARQAGA